MLHLTAATTTKKKIKQIKQHGESKTTLRNELPLSFTCVPRSLYVYSLTVLKIPFRQNENKNKTKSTKAGERERMPWQQKNQWKYESNV